MESRRKKTCSSLNDFIGTDKYFHKIMEKLPIIMYNKENKLQG